MTEIESETREAVRILTMTSANGLNSLSAADRTNMAAALTAADEDPDVRAVVLRGSSRAFSVGADVMDFPAAPCDPTQYLLEALAVFSLPERLSKPVVSVVSGHAIAGGFELALATDWIFAEPGARMSLSEATFGMLPGYALSRLSSIVGRPRARRLMITAEVLDPQSAVAFGLPVTASATGRGLADALDFCRQTMGTAPASLAEVKRRTAFTGDDADFRRTVERYAQLWNEPDAVARVADFRND